jgi:hypothetical protein
MAKRAAIIVLCDMAVLLMRLTIVIVDQFLGNGPQAHELLKTGDVKQEKWLA